MDFPVEDPLLQDSVVAIEPRFSPRAHSWLEPQVTKAVCGIVRLTNSSTEPHTLKKHEHVGELSLMYDPATSKTEPHNTVKNSRPPIPGSGNYTSHISVDPNNVLPKEIRKDFQ